MSTFLLFLPIFADNRVHITFLQKVFESFNARKQAKDLLECAKRAVEMAIEQDEQTAINWLESVSQRTDPWRVCLQPPDDA